MAYHVMITNTEFRPDHFDIETKELLYPRHWIVWFHVSMPNSGHMSSNIYIEMDENATEADFVAYILAALGQ